MAGKGKGSQFFVWIILGLLIFGSAGFGVTNFGGSIRSVATVGETEIEIDTYGRAIQRELRALQDATGQQMTFSQAQSFGLEVGVLQRLVGLAALDESTRIAGLSVGDERVSTQILEIPGFRGLDGQFDREAYQFTLEQNGMTVTDFETSIREELSRNLLQAALATGIEAAPGYADAIHRFIGEERSISVARLTSEALETPPESATDAEVQAFYEANPDAFTLPERRRITWAWLDPVSVAADVEVGDEAIKSAYENRIDEFVVPERRMVERLVFPDQAAADAAYAAIKSGDQSFEDAVSERNLTLADVDLGLVAVGDLGDAGAGVFGLAEPDVAGPLPSEFGPALFRVNAILDSNETSLDDAYEQLRNELAIDLAEGVIADDLESLDDLLAGGATLEEMADDGGMTLGQIDWTGTESEGLAGYAAFVEAASTAAQGDFPELIELEDGGIFALRLDEVIEPTLQKLDDVRAAAQKGATDAKIRDALRTLSETLRAQMDSGEQLTDAGVEVQTQKGIRRQDLVEFLPEGSAARLFEMDERETDIVEQGAEILIVRLDSVRPPDPNAPEAAPLRQALGAEIGQALAQDVLAQFSRAVEAKAGLTINQAALNAVHAQLP